MAVKKSLSRGRAWVFTLAFATLLFGVANIGAAIVIGMAQTVNWSAITNGSGPGGQPSSIDTILVYQGSTLRVDVTNAVCASIQLSQTGQGPGTLVFNAGSRLTVSGTVTMGVNNGSAGSFGTVTMTSGGTLICQSLAVGTNTIPPSVWTPGAGTVQLTANNTLPTISITSFNNLIISAGTTITLGRALTVANLTQSGGNIALGANTLTVTGSHYAGTNTVSGTGAYTKSSGIFETASTSGVAGNLATTGTKSLAAVAFIFDGTAAQVTSTTMPATVSQITVSNAAGITLSQSTATTNLNLANGNLLTTTAYQLTVAHTNNSAISGGGSQSYVVGTLQKSFGSGTNQSFAFPIGTATAYTPVTLSSMDIGGSGSRSITLQSSDGDHPQLGTSGIITNKSVNRYWTLTQSGSTFTNYTIAFNYPTNDLDAAAVSSSFIAQIYTNSTWSSAIIAGTPTSTSAVVTNYAAGSASFALGEPKSNQTITFPSPGDQTYGVLPIALTATASSGLPVTYTVSGPATMTNSTLYIGGAGSVTIVASQAGNTNYNPATSVTNTIAVAPKAVTVASGLTANNKVYDGTTTATISSNNVVLSGVLAGDAANVKLSTNGYTASFATATVGSGKTVTVSGLTLSGSAAGNYTLTQPSGLTANITAAVLTVSGITASNKVYDGTTTAVLNVGGATLVGVVSGDTVTLNGGSAAFTNGSVNGVSYRFYRLTNGECCSSAIGFTRVTAEAGRTLIGNQLDASPDNTLDSVFAQTALPAGTAVQKWNGGGYDFYTNSGGVWLPNGGATLAPGEGAFIVNPTTNSFTVAFVGLVREGELINPLAVSYNWVSSMVPQAGGVQSVLGYNPDSGDIVLKWSVTNFVGYMYYEGEWFDGADEPVAEPVINVGEGFIIQNNTGSPKNWTRNFSACSEQGGCVPPTLGNSTVTSNTFSFSVSGPMGSYWSVYSSSDLVNWTLAGGVTMSTGSATGAFADKTVGAGKTVTVSGLTISGTDAGNYTLTQPTTTADITAATVTITANDTNRVYGADNPAFTASYSGFVGGDTISVVQGEPGFSTPATTASSVAGSPYSIIVTNGTLSATNYTFTFVNGQLTIAPASTTNAVATSVNPSPTGSNVTFTATLTVVSPGSGIPTGTVQFLAEGTPLGLPVTLAGGVANLTTNSLAHGTYTITAEYAGDGNFFGITNTLSPNQVINTAPAAANDILGRYQTTGVKVRVSTLLTNDTDADSDSLTFNSVDSTSTAGGAIVENGNWIHYTPPAGFTNADSFSYVITDSSLQATGSVFIDIRVDLDPSQNVTAVQDLGNGSSRVSFAGIPGRTYTIQYATNLVTPDWQALGTNTAGVIGQFEFADAPGVGAPARFYRSTYP